MHVRICRVVSRSRHGLQMAKYRSTEIADRVSTDNDTEVVWNIV